MERQLRLYRLTDHLRGRSADVILTNADSNPRAVAELKRLHWGVALGDDYSATKSFVSMTLLKGRRVTLLPDLEVAGIFGLVVCDGKADVGVVARSFVESQPSDECNPTRAEEGFRVIARGLPQPALVVALSPKLDDGDRRVLARLLMDLPAQVRTRIRPANARV